jgi:hypothetical protein
MSPAKKSASSKAPKKAVAKSAPTHPSWTDMIKVLTISAISFTSPSLVHVRSRSLAELYVVNFYIVFLKRGGFVSGHCRAALPVVCVAPTRCLRASGASCRVTIPI